MKDTSGNTASSPPVYRGSARQQVLLMMVNNNIALVHNLIIQMLWFFRSSFVWIKHLFLPQIRKMDLEARSLQPSVKAMLLAKIREYKTDLNNLKNEVKRVTSGNTNQAARDGLLESGMADAMMVCISYLIMFIWFC